MTQFPTPADFSSAAPGASWPSRSAAIAPRERAGARPSPGPPTGPRRSTAASRLAASAPAAAARRVAATWGWPSTPPLALSPVVLRRHHPRWCRLHRHRLRHSCCWASTAGPERRCKDFTDEPAARRQACRVRTGPRAAHMPAPSPRRGRGAGGRDSLFSAAADIYSVLLSVSFAGSAVPPSMRAFGDRPLQR